VSEDQKPYNAGDEQAVKSRGEKQKKRDLRKQMALRRFLSDSDGRLWMWDLLEFCGVFHLSFSTEALVMAFNEGRRNIGNHLMAEITRLPGGPELYMRMATENQAKEKSNGE
jgi:hypothetical protein